MSDLQDVIAKSAVVAFNSGLQAGIREERQRILKLIDHFEEGNGSLWDEKMIVNANTLREVIVNEESR